AHPYIAQRLKEQADTLEHVIFANFTHKPAIELAERLLAKLPENQSKFFFSDNGSTAIEIGLKMCFQYWHNIGQTRTKIIALEGAYHGDTFGAMSVGGRSAFSKPFLPFLFDVEFIKLPTEENKEESLAQLKAILAKEPVAGFIFEPLVQGAAGMRMYSAAVLEEMVALCKAEDVICIADEVMIGFGRTGNFFATDALTTKPDIHCMSKGLTGGTMALGGTTCTEEIFQAFWSDDMLKAFFHGHSCTGNPLACAVALASLDLMEREETWTNIRRIIERHELFQDRICNYDIVTNIRQTGVVIAFEIVTTEGNSYFNSLRDTIWNFFLERGLLLRPLGNTVYILPPYCITEEELTKVYEAIIELLDMLSN
ncbi:MAG: adenosylmethionine--8-amino-7-oxononanoate transaminase, partial [Saprospiraceae bacterium]|nr:adenosylmethionine--8-amino-7-oxononanoate transaminase [Saprospiraceae bacterium]